MILNNKKINVNVCLVNFFFELVNKVKRSKNSLFIYLTWFIIFLIKKKHNTIHT